MLKCMWRRGSFPFITFAHNSKLFLEAPPFTLESSVQFLCPSMQFAAQLSAFWDGGQGGDTPHPRLKEAAHIAHTAQLAAARAELAQAAEAAEARWQRERQELQLTLQQQKEEDVLTGARPPVGWPQEACHGRSAQFWSGRGSTQDHFPLSPRAIAFWNIDPPPPPQWSPLLLSPSCPGSCYQGPHLLTCFVGSLVHWAAHTEYFLGVMHACLCKICRNTQTQSFCARCTLT